MIDASPQLRQLKNFFAASAVEAVIELVLKVNTDAMRIIQSIILIDGTESVRKKYGTKNIVFNLESLRKSKVLYDNLYPSRIIVGCDRECKEQTTVLIG